MKIKKGDNVIVIRGKNSGTRGKVLRALPARDAFVVDGVNVRSRRQRARRAGQKGQVLSIPTPIRSANVALWCEKCKKGVRTGSAVKGGKKVRACKKCAVVL